MTEDEYNQVKQEHADLCLAAQVIRLRATDTLDRQEGESMLKVEALLRAQLMEPRGARIQEYRETLGRLKEEEKAMHTVIETLWPLYGRDYLNEVVNARDLSGANTLRVAIGKLARIEQQLGYGPDEGWGVPAA